MAQQKISFFGELFSTKGQNKSYVYMLISCFAWVSGYVYANEHKFSPIETNLSRSIIIVIGSYIICRMMNLNIEFKSSKTWRTLLKRHLIFVLQGLVLAQVQFILPLGITHTIGSAGPMFTLIVQTISSKNKQNIVTGKKLAGCLIAAVGIVFTSNGKFIYGFFDKNYEFHSSFQNYISSSYTVMISATIILVITMIAWAYGVLITQEAECHSFEIVFHFAVTNLLINGLGYTFLSVKRSMQQIYISFFWVGIFLLIAQICFTLALNLSENIALTNITAFMVVIVGYGISIIRYGQAVDIISLLGTVLVIGGVSLVILTKQVKNTANYQNHPGQIPQQK